MLTKTAGSFHSSKNAIGLHFRQRQAQSGVSGGLGGRWGSGGLGGLILDGRIGVGRGGRSCLGVRFQAMAVLLFVYLSFSRDGGVPFT